MQLYQAMQQLLQQAASHHWRGLLVLQSDPQIPDTRVQWPSQAVCMGGNYPVPLNSYRAYLGRACACVVLDFRREQHADALAAMAGTLVGGGLLVLQTSTKLSPFLHHLLQRLPHHLAIRHVVQPAEPIDLSQLPLPKVQIATGIQLSDEQLQVFNALRQHSHACPDQPALLSAPRGRGKSTVLSALAQHLQQTGQPVVISAPSKHQANVMLHHCQVSANDDLVPPRFIAPDALLADNAPRVQGTLLLDEAANLPRHMLDKLLERYPGVIMATTTQGYECCGRGFLIQFQRILQQRFNHALELRLSQPFRYAADCPLEQWLEHRLLLQGGDEEPVLTPAPSSPTITYRHARADELEPAILNTCFGLLMDAHYQTSANDLKLLLDDKQQSLLLQYHGEQLTAVAWLAREGPLSAELAADIVAGRRRPPGALLPQLLARHFREPSLATLQMLRIVRIAVRPSLHQQGLGSAMLTHIEQFATAAEIKLIGTSFGASTDLVAFWQRKNGYLSVRLGTRPDTVSGRYACVCLKASSAEFTPLIEQWSAFFQYELPAYAQSLDIREDLLQQLTVATTGSFTPLQQSYNTLSKRRLDDFVRGHFDFPSLQATLLTHPDWLATNPLLAAAAANLAVPEALKHQFHIHGRKDLLKALRQICFELSVKI